MPPPVALPPDAAAIVSRSERETVAAVARAFREDPRLASAWAGLLPRFELVAPKLGRVLRLALAEARA